MPDPQEEITAQETVQTVQEPDVQRVPYIEVAQDQQGEWHWVLWATNGRAMAINAIGYKRRNDATNAIDSLQNALGTKLKVVIARD